MSDPAVGRTIVVTSVATQDERARAVLMIESLRAFGGGLAGAPVVLFEVDGAASCATLPPDVSVHPLPCVPFGDYALAGKVSACALAEALAPAGTESLIWFNPDVVVVRPPALLELGRGFDAAVRPVHVRNIGLPVEAPLDGYWRRICEVAGVRDIAASVESFVDAQRIRAYFNTHAFSVAPSRGLFGRWRACFEILVADRTFQAGACAEPRHRTFLHQALLSALIAGMVDPGRVRALPPDYAYPYNLHGSVPRERRARALDALVCFAYEERTLDPYAVDDIAIQEPLRSWLTSRVDRQRDNRGS